MKTKLDEWYLQSSYNVEEQPVKFLSKSEREDLDGTAGSVPSYTPKSGTPGPSPAPNEDIEDLPF